MSFFDKIKQILNTDDEYEDPDEWWYENTKTKSNQVKSLSKTKEKVDKGISEELQEKLIMNENLSIKECIDLLEHTIQKLNKTIGIDDKER